MRTLLKKGGTGVPSPMGKLIAISAKPLFLLAAALFLALPSARAAAMPFEPGERLTYTIKWGVVTAGTAVLEVKPMAVIDGEEVFHFSLAVRTSSFVDRFYKVRDHMQGFVRTDMSGSVLYLLKKEEGRHLRDVRVFFDPETLMARSTNFGEERPPVRIFPGTFDPLSVVYAFRAMPLDPDLVMEIPVSDGRRTAMGVGRIGNRERVRVPAGDFRTGLVEPDMHDVGGVFDKSGDAPLRIWFSDDVRRLPVRLSSRVAVGSFRAELVAVEQIPAGEQQMALILGD
jgi:hypothetical protein